MELLASFIDLVLHLDTHLLALTQEYGVWVYGILFLIIFCETGLVVTPFLPGDSLLFVAGALCGMGSLEIQLLVPVSTSSISLRRIASDSVGRTSTRNATNCSRACRAMGAEEAGGNWADMDRVRRWRPRSGRWDPRPCGRTV